MRSKIISILICLMLLCSPGWSGVDFDSTDDILSCGSGSSLDNLGSFSVYVRFVADTGGEGNLGAFFHKSPAGSTVKSFRIENRGGASGTATVTMTAVYTGVPLSVTPSDNSITFGQETTAIFSWGGLGTTPHIYINGVEPSYRLQQAGTVAETSEATNNFSIGAREDGSQTFDGIIRELAVWTEPISAAEAVLIHNSQTRYLPLQIQPSALNAYWVLADQPDGSSGDGKVFLDMTPNANTCTGNDGANNTGLTAKAEGVLTYP